MKSLFIFTLLSGFTMTAQATVVVNYTYLKAKKPVKKSLSFKEVKRAYAVVKKNTFTPPSRQEFFKDFLRYKMGVEVALNDPKMVRNPNLGAFIINPYLREAFYQELYKHFAESKLKKQMKKIDNTARNFSDSTLKGMYEKDPEYNIFFITVQHPINPNPKQLKEAENRSKQIYAQVTQSKKPFLELVALYSDDKYNGSLAINRSRAAIFPTVYKQLKSMKNGQISRPIRVPFGYVIVKLNKKAPFSEANTTAIKANYFNTERTKIFNKYFDGLKKDFRVNVVNQEIINTL